MIYWPGRILNLTGRGAWPLCSDKRLSDFPFFKSRKASSPDGFPPQADIRRNSMIILGIDTSCDDTSAGAVEDGQRVLSNVVHSQVELHHPHGGVVPELASREHLKNIIPVVSESLARADLRMEDVDGIAVTVGPGLVGALLVGLYYAKGLAYVHDIPLAGINHLEGHILSIFLEERAPSFPFVALTVSGGHTCLYHVKGYGQYTQMGQTLDDAA